MPTAVQVWFINWPWWAEALLALALILVGVIVVILIWEWWEMRGVGDWEGPEEPESTEIIYPYYVENESLRELAHAVKLDLPKARSVTKAKKIGVGGKGISGEKGSSETEEYSGQLPLTKLADAVEESWSRDGTGPATGVANAAYVSDERALSTAIDQIREDFPTTSETAELLSRLKETFSGERVEALSTKKREEFEGIGKRNQMLVFRGQFGLREEGRNDSGPTLQLTHFNPTSGYISPRSDQEDYPEAELIPVPEGVALHVVLPDAKALMPAGRERIQRAEPFYAGVIAHSPSFNGDAGTLTCSAWAIWGEATPNWTERVSYEHRGPYGGGPPYGPGQYPGC